jgi:transcriptional regulator with PAS, ATPase and Fis domain
LKEVFDLVEQVAPTRACVLIRGESGTGKELIARTIHRRSERQDQPFVAINCAAIPETLLESELFGVERGTATGVTERKGKFEVAQGGTVFLDEIGDMSRTVQAKILRVLQEKEFERVGGRKPVRSDVRVIAATSKNLEQAIADGTFRDDLFYRLNVVSITLPPLRERRPDIPLLAQHFVQQYSREYRRPVKRLAGDALARLMDCPWPGNVRELENTIERAVILARGEAIDATDLPSVLQPATTASFDFRQARTQARSDAQVLEKGFVAQTLQQHNWNMTRAAQTLGITRRHLYRLLDKYRLKRNSPGKA